MNLAVIFILSILGGILLYAFLLLHKEKKRDNYLFLSFLLLIFVLIYCVSVLDYRIGGSNIEIEKIKKEISKKVLVDLGDNYIYSATETARLAPEDFGLQKTMIEKRNKAESLYKDAGLTEEEIKNKLNRVNGLIVHDLTREIRYLASEELGETGKENASAIKRDFEAKYDAALKGEMTMASYPEKIKEKLKEYNITSSKVKTAIDQLNYFVEHKNLK